MTVASVEALAGLSPGAQIRVRQRDGTHTWIRADDGQWARDGVKLETSMFAPLVKEGRVVDVGALPPEPGELYTSATPRSGRPTYHYLVLGPEGNRTRFLRFRNNLYQQEVFYDAGQLAAMRRTGDRPDWYQPVWGAVQHLQSQLADTVSLLQGATDSATTLADRVRALEDARANRPGVVQVQVSGTSEIPTEKADGHVPSAARIESTVSRWNATLEYETVGEGCLCPRVSREWIVEQLGIDPEQPSGTFSYTTDCGRH